MIKPEDIPDSLVERTYQPSGDVRQDVADFLNAAIEAGLVSPPAQANEDPRVLRRSVEIALIKDYRYFALDTVDKCVEQARKELESEEQK